MGTSSLKDRFKLRDALADVRANLCHTSYATRFERVLFLIAGLSLSLFIGITYSVLSGEEGLNRELFVWINIDHSSQVMDILMPVITVIFDIPFWVIMILCVWYFDRRMLGPFKKKKVTVLLAVTLCISTILALILQQLFAVPRPDGIEGMRLLIWKDTQYGYPSAHAMRGFAVAALSIFFLKKRFAIPSLFLTGMVAYSRIYVGVHYPYDVLSGSCLGVFIGILLFFVGNNKYLKR